MVWAMPRTVTRSCALGLHGDLCSLPGMCACGCHNPPQPVQTLAVYGDPFCCVECGGTATVLLRMVIDGDEQHYAGNPYCDRCHQQERQRAYATEETDNGR